MRISDWSSDVCSSDLRARPNALRGALFVADAAWRMALRRGSRWATEPRLSEILGSTHPPCLGAWWRGAGGPAAAGRDRKGVVEGKSMVVRVDLRGGRII